ncbi:chemotaxis protein CheW [Allocoleopsis sp.]|uniref:chemotaxis protein CheW n=1 Tax=Allocoleopsis sp. TaxID=3088169 RepID=UPI002FCF10A0
MDISVDVETDSLSLKSFQDRYILTQVGHQKIVFPSQWVAEIMLIERSQILNLPFYDSRVLGVVHRQGGIIPLVTLQVANPMSQRPRIQETLTAIRLSQLVSELAGVGLIVDQVIGSISQEELSAKEQKATESSNPQIEVFQPESISPSIWQPR